MKIRTPVLSALSMLVLALPTVRGEAADLTGLYVGGNFGRARNAYDTNSLDQQYRSAAKVDGVTLSIDDRSTRRLSHVWWVDVGYLFNPYIGAEISYIHPGEMQYLSSGTLTLNGNTQVTSTSTAVRTHGPAVAVVGRLPLNDWLEFELRLGDYIGKAYSENLILVGTQGSPVNSSKASSSLLAGAGIAFKLTEHCSLQLDYLRLHKTGDDASTGKFSVDMATGGLRFSF